MSIAFWFWLLYVIALVFWGFGFNRAPEARWGAGHSIVLWLLVGLLGWSQFGSPIK